VSSVPILSRAYFVRISERWRPKNCFEESLPATSEARSNPDPPGCKSRNFVRLRKERECELRDSRERGREGKRTRKRRC